MAELIFWPGRSDKSGREQTPELHGLDPGLQLRLASQQTPVGGELDMRNIDAVLSDLEYRRLRRRFAMHPAEAMVLNCGTWAVIAVLRFVAR